MRRVITVLSAVAALMVAGAESASAGPTDSSPVQSVPRAPGPYPAACRNGYVGLSFDDGPTALTPLYLAVLQKYGVRAYFFDIGQQVATYPTYTQLQVAAGMWIGNHTWDHPQMATLTHDEQYAELARAQTEIRAVTGTAPILWRPPFDSINGSAAQAGYDQGLTWVSWTTDSGDYSGATAARVEANALAVPAGGVILMHDGYTTTLRALPGIIKGLAARGLCVGKVVPSPVPTITSWDETYYAMVLPAPVCVLNGRRSSPGCAQ